MSIRSLKSLPVEYLQRGVYQPRHDFNKEALSELAASIQAQGIIEPLVVRPIKGENRYEIVAGERRWRAAQLAGLAEVPCVVSQYSDDVAAEVTIVENIQRQDLNPLEEARAYQRLADEFGYIHEEIAAAVGKSRAKITNSLRLLRLDPRVQDFIRLGALTGAHGKALAALEPGQQMQLAERAIAREWSVRKIEKEVKKLSQGIELLCSANDPNVLRLQRLLAEHLGSKVAIEYDTNGKGKLSVDFSNYEIFQGILNKIGVEE